MYSVLRLRRSTWLAWALLTPGAAIVLGVYLCCTVWSVVISFTASHALPNLHFVGWHQYERLFANERWQISVRNLAIFAVGMIAVCLCLGFLLAVFIDQRVRGEGVLRTIYLYPYAMSFIVTGVAWQWMLNPELGLQHVVRGFGFPDFYFDWIVDPHRVVYTLVLAGVWQASGLVMAILLAGLRGIDPEIWNAARVDGIPAWRMYLFVILPMLQPMLLTAALLLAITVIKSFDLVVAMTHGGPGIASELPAKFIMDFLFERANIGLALAASTVLLAAVICIVAPWLYGEHMRRARPA